MLHHLALSTAVIVLFGCQAPNPYQAQSTPLPPAPAAAATYFDVSAYPASSENKTYNYWCWYEVNLTPVLNQDTAQRVLAEQLEQFGLRAAPSMQQCELKVRLSNQYSQRRRHSDYNYPTAHYGYGYGCDYPFNDRYRYSGVGVDVPITSRSYTEHYLQLTLTFIDAQTHTMVWQAQSETASHQQGNSSEKALRQAINSMLKRYH